MLEIDESRLLDQLEAAVAASLLGESSERVGRFRFAHALINQTLYEGLGATRRARMHQRVAEALEELYGEDPARAPRQSSRFTGAWPPSSVDKAKAAGLRAPGRSARPPEPRAGRGRETVRRRRRADRRLSTAPSVVRR